MLDTKNDKLIAVSILFIIITFLGAYAINTMQSGKKEYYLNVQNELLNTKYKTSYKYFKIMSKDIYDMYSQNAKLLSLISKANNSNKKQKNLYRHTLYQLLIKNYQRLNNMGISQVHFHTTDNKSFLRMYAPNKFGDDLSQLRHSVVLANKTLKPQEGFESCKFMVGLRFIYPLFNKDKKHIGSVEISFSAKQLLDNITDDFIYDSHILVNKSIATSSIIESEYLVNYKPTWETDDYFMESYSHKNINDKNIYTKISTPKLKNKIILGIKSKEVFSLDIVYNYQNIILTFLPIPSANGIKNISYIVKYIESDYLSNVNIEREYLNILFLSILFILYIFALYVVINREKLKELALYDNLTKLPNRALFEIEFQNEINRALRYKKSMALMFIDLDGFKAVNDTYGHQTGDNVLILVAEVLLSSIRESDLASRLSGDEFTIILTDVQDSKEAINVANNIIKKINEDIIISENASISIGASIGISIYPQDSKDIKELVKYADSMMYKAKENGKNQVFLYN